MKKIRQGDELIKIIVISEETRQRLLSEDRMLDAIESSKTKKEK